MTALTPTPEQLEALKIAAELIAAGVPVFAAAPNSDRPGEYHLPKMWEDTKPDPRVLDRWKPGWALGAVGGAVADFLDIDPRNGGRVSETELRTFEQFPRSFGEQETPSGGSHHIISATGERKSTNFMPGLDLQSGGPTDAYGKNGRGFIYIAPTVRPSKAVETLGQLRAYRWTHRPDLELLDDFRGADDSTEGVIARVHAKRGAGPLQAPAPAQVEHSSSLFGGAAGGGQVERAFTRAEAEAFCTPYLEALATAQIGDIEEKANTAAVALAHFVPAIWDAGFAFTALEHSLAQTAYNGQTWRADKFLPVLDGRRPPMDGWKATARAEPGEPVAVQGDEVDALLAEMLSPAQIRDRPRPRPLIKGLLNFDSESWIIGEPGSKKSFVALDMAGHVAAGRDWQGFKVTAGRVVMIIAEGAGGIGARIDAWEKEHGPMAQEIHMLPRPVQAKSAKAWAVLVEACRRLEPAMVVVDTQARVTVGLEENSATEMGIYVEAVRALREATGACVLTVHHTGRKGGDARGSSAIDGAQHTELKVESKGLEGSLITEKQKDLPMAPTVPLKFVSVQVGTDEDGDPITSLALVADAFRRLAGGQEEPGEIIRAYVPVFDEKDKWRRRILDVLFLHAPQGIGMTKAAVAGQLTQAGEWMGKGKLDRNGSYSGAWKDLVELLDEEQEPILVMHGTTRFEIGSEAVRAGLQADLKINTP